MKLTEKQKLVLWAAQHNADAPLAELCRQTGCRQHTARDALDRLLAAGIIYPMHPINISALGYTEYLLFFALAIKESRRREELLNYLIACDRVSLLLEMGGEFEYGLNFCGRQVDDFSAFLEDLGERFGDLFSCKSVAMRHSYLGFGRKYLGGKRLRTIVQMGPAAKPAAVDAIDHVVLRGLSQSRETSYARIAKAAGLPPATFHYRLKQLTAAGVVLNAIYAVTPTLFGMQRMRLMLDVKSISRKFHAGFVQYCAAHLQIVNLVRTIGAWDYEVGVELESYEDMPQIVQEIQYRFGAQINALKVLPIFRFLKGRSYPFETPPA